MSQTATSREATSAAGDALELVFIYGELRRGGSEAFRMEGAKYVRMGEVAGTLLEISGIPALVPRRERERGWVTGELFQVSPDHLLSLDTKGESAGDIEGSCYERVRLKVYQPGSQTLLGEAWVWQRIGYPVTGCVVRSGDWLDVSHPRPVPWFTFTAVACLIGSFASVDALSATFPSLHAVPRYRHAFIMLISLVPMVACVIAWWGLRRRERYEFLTMLVLVVAGLISLPLGVSMFVEILSRLMGWRSGYF